MSEIYRRKPLEVTAVEWTGENVEEMTGFLGSHFDLWQDIDEENEPEASVLTSKHSAWRHLERGDWVLIASGGVISAMDADDFAADFEAVDRG